MDHYNGASYPKAGPAAEALLSCSTGSYAHAPITGLTCVKTPLSRRPWATAFRAISKLILTLLTCEPVVIRGAAANAPASL